MKKIIPLLLLLAACGSRRAASTTAVVPAVKHYTYRVAASYPHSEGSFTQGLEFSEGQLWESTGIEGESRVLQVDLKTGRAVREVSTLPGDQFGEGITILNGKIYQLTWLSKVGYVYDARTGRKSKSFPYEGEGWGLANDGFSLYMSDGTEVVRVLDPTTLAVTRTFTVRLQGRAMPLLNELEWVDGRLWANLYTTDTILIIDPRTGVVEGTVDLRGLLSPTEITPRTDVLNGIAVLDGRIFVTGKNWPRLFEIELIEQ